ncbi:MAG: glycosyltransferase family 9 protein [Myxococcota bacterium]
MTPKKVLIVDPAFVGDVVFSGPLIRALSAGLPGVEVGLVVRPPAQAVASRLVGLGRVFVFDKRGKDAGLGGLLAMAKTLAAEAYALALIPHPSFRSVLLAQRARIPARVGAAPPPAAWLLTERRAVPDHLVRSRLALAEGLVAPEHLDPSLAGVLRRLGDGGGPRARPRVGLVLGANWATKRWATAQLHDFVRGFDTARAELAFLGSAEDRPLLEALRGAGPAGAQAIDAVGGSLEDLIRAIEACDRVVAGDTGPLQIARGLGVDVVALFGPTSELRHDFSPKDRVIVHPLPCRPCHHHGPKVCPLGHHRCMVDLPAREVLAALEPR